MLLYIFCWSLEIPCRLAAAICASRIYHLWRDTPGWTVVEPCDPGAIKMASWFSPLPNAFRKQTGEQPSPCFCLIFIDYSCLASLMMTFLVQCPFLGNLRCDSFSLSVICFNLPFAGPFAVLLRRSRWRAGKRPSRIGCGKLLVLSNQAILMWWVTNSFCVVEFLSTLRRLESLYGCRSVV